MTNNIFISSTCYDLIDLRAELKQFLIDNKLTPIMSDEIDSHFLTHDTNSIETCLVNLRSSDVVVLILSQRYGSSLEKAGFGDFSATHLEYNEAIKEGKKIFVFVRDRLEADYIHFRKTNILKGLSWIREKDIKLFDIIEEHKKLTANAKNNWYFTFKNSVEIKERLRIELMRNFSDLRLDYLTENDKMPFLNVKVEANFSKHFKQMNIKILINNIGSKPAVNPIINISSDNGGIIAPLIEDEEIKTIIPFAPESIVLTFDNAVIDTPPTGEYKENYLFEIKYQNIYGDFICEKYEFNFQIYAYLHEDEFDGRKTKIYEFDHVVNFLEQKISE